MTLEVEDGTGKVNADSYVTVAYVTTYLTQRGVAEADWASLEAAAKEAAIRNATDYLQQRYGGRWRGTRRTYAQALDWPRAWVPRSEDPIYDGATSSTYYWWRVDEIPTPLKQASALLALKATTGELSVDIDRRTTEETVGPITIKYPDDASSREQVEYKAVEETLRRLLSEDDETDITGDSVRG